MGHNFGSLLNREIENRPFPEPNRNRRVGAGSLEPEPDHVGTGNTGTVYHLMFDLLLVQKLKPTY